jgi:CAAX protease family protein
MSTSPSPAPPPGHPAPPERPELPDGVVAAEPGPAAWRPWTAWAALVAALAAATVLGGIVLVAGGGDAQDPPAASQLVATLLQDGCFIGAAWFFAGLAGRPRPSQFGLRLPGRPLRAAGLVAAGYAGFIAVSGIWLALVGQSDTSDDLPDKLGADDSTLGLLAVVFVVAVAAPVAEEFLFRGYFFTALRNWRGLWPAALVTGLVFGSVHAVSSPWAFLLPLALFGVVLCLLYDRTGSLYPCIALHCINNSIALGSALGWSWQIPITAVAALAVIGTGLEAVRRRSAAERPAPAPA